METLVAYCRANIGKRGMVDNNGRNIAVKIWDICFDDTGLKYVVTHDGIIPAYVDVHAVHWIN